MYYILSILIISILGISLLIILFELLYYHKLRYKYGKKTAIKKYFERGRPFISKERPETKRLLVNVGWRLSTEQFYMLKIFIALISLASAFAVVQTNRSIKIESIRKDINYKRNIADTGLLATKDLVAYEELLLEKSEIALSQYNLDLNDEKSLEIIEATIKEYASYEGYQIIAKRLLLKLQDIQSEKEDTMPLTMSLFFAYLMYTLPGLIGKIKIKLINNKKDWETLNCMATYNIIGRLPNCKIENLVSGMKEITTIYKDPLDNFGEALKKRELNKCNKILETIDEEGMEELLEQLEVASEQGINVTLLTVEDIMQSKMEWLQITAIKRRKVKTSMAFIPISIILLLLFTYMMYGMTVISTSNFIEL